MVSAAPAIGFPRGGSASGRSGRAAAVSIPQRGAAAERPSMLLNSVDSALVPNIRGTPLG